MSATTKHNAQCENCKLKRLFVAAALLALHKKLGYQASGRQASPSLRLIATTTLVEPESRLQIESLFRCCCSCLLLLSVLLSCSFSELEFIRIHKMYMYPSASLSQPLSLSLSRFA